MWIMRFCFHTFISTNTIICATFTWKWLFNVIFYSWSNYSQHYCSFSLFLVLFLVLFCCLVFLFSFPFFFSLKFWIQYKLNSVSVQPSNINYLCKKKHVKVRNEWGFYDFLKLQDYMENMCTFHPSIHSSILILIS